MDKVSYTKLIYYILMKSFRMIIESELWSKIYVARRIDNLSKYKKEDILAYHIYMTIRQIISYS